MDIDPVIAFAAFFTQVGARQLRFNFTKAQQYVITHPVTQGLILFAMFYLSTRRMLVAFSLLVLYFLAIRVFLNENHPWNIFSQYWLAKEGFIQTEDETAKKSPLELYYANLSRLP
jgi:hypothetical protein